MHALRAQVFSQEDECDDLPVRDKNGLNTSHVARGIHVLVVYLKAIPLGYLTFCGLTPGCSTQWTGQKRSLSQVLHSLFTLTQNPHVLSY